MTKIMTRLIVTVLFILGLFLASPAGAVDLTVTCTDSGCDMFPAPNTALFEEPDIKPGWNIGRRLIVINKGGADCSLVMGTKNEVDPANLAPVLFTAINDGTVNWFGTKQGLGGASSDKNFSDLFNLGGINLGTVAAGGSVDYLWTVTMDPNAGNSYQGKTMTFDFDTVFTCDISTPILTIEKDNDKKGKTLGVDDIVAYTVVVKNTGAGTSYNTKVEDVQPIGTYFDYIEDSGKLSCTGRPDNVSIASTGANPYFWLLGDMLSGDQCTLTYQLKILSTAIPGTHYNIAMAIGQDEAGNDIFSDPVRDPFKVGNSLNPSAGVSSQVLGAATAIGQVLGAATGSPTFWLLLALIMVLGGLALKFMKKNKKKILPAVIIAFALLFGMSGIAKAEDVAPAVAIVQLPEYSKDSPLELSYTALDAGGSGLKSVTVNYHKEGDSWQNIGTYTENARIVTINSGKIEQEAKYYFRATACDNDSNCAESDTSTTIDRSGPPQPENFSKEKTGVQSYRIKWHNADSNDLYQVYIYRADHRDFTADNGSKVAQVDVSKNTDSQWDDAVVPDSSKDYYYVIRSIDRAGNVSNIVGDIYNVEVVSSGAEGQPLSGSENISGQEAQYVLPGGGGPAGSGGQILGEETLEGSPSTESSQSALLGGGEESPEDIETKASASSAKLSSTAGKFIFALGAVVLLAAGWWYFRSKKD